MKMGKWERRIIFIISMILLFIPIFVVGKSLNGLDIMGVVTIILLVVAYFFLGLCIGVENEDE